MSFIEIPTLDLSQARRPESKPAFLAALRQALLEVGFLYISSTAIDPGLEAEVVEQGRAFFDLPEKKKMEIEMKNVNSFLGMYIYIFVPYSSSSPQATAVLPTKSLPTKSTGASSSTSPPRSRSPLPTRPATTPCSRQTNGPTRPSCRASAPRLSSTWPP